LGQINDHFEIFFCFKDIWSSHVLLLLCFTFLSARYVYYCVVLLRFMRVCRILINITYLLTFATLPVGEQRDTEMSQNPESAPDVYISNY